MKKGISTGVDFKVKLIKPWRGANNWRGVKNSIPIGRVLNFGANPQKGEALISQGIAIKYIEKEVIMTRKHYIKIAKAIKNHRPSLKYDNYVDFITDLCVIFEEDNDRFDSDKFKEATGVL